MSDIITTIPLIIKELKTQVTGKIPDLKYAFDPQLSFESGTRMLRSANKYRGLRQEQYPLFLFNRSVLRYHEQLGKRALHKSVDLNAISNYTAPEYRTALGEFDLRIAFVSPNMSEIEGFEIEYHGTDGISSIKELNVSVPGIDDGPFVYSLSWADLEDVLIEADSWYAKTLTVSCKIQGWFVTMRQPVDLIKNIYLDVYGDEPEVLLEQFTVV